MTLARSGPTFYSSWDGTQFWSGSYWGDSLSSIYLVSQNNWGATELTNVTFQSFSLTSSAIPEPPTYAALAGLAALGLAVLKRRRKRHA